MLMVFVNSGVLNMNNLRISQWSDLPLVLTSEQAAAVLQVTRRTITNMLDRGDLRGVKIGKEWRISRSELVRLIEGEAPPVPDVRRPSDSSSPEAVPKVFDRDGILVVEAQPVEDLIEFVQQEHERRIADLMQQVRP
ncbi:helix-turn-helix domain-containing protein [Caldilinea sp.]|uniref:helix-turn-helix domain-containing protein n=1 Tax=Caldilinea sp. TaxID=2293560 RepID=UPI0021DE1A5C|nr:helix-turn-helix domain-containing protein [Caldilinea sp.]GIV69220.1 MAG: hypothetical protein KatS3mg048_2082 [Caldilinea sp.]